MLAHTQRPFRARGAAGARRVRVRAVEPSRLRSPKLTHQQLAETKRALIEAISELQRRYGRVGSLLPPDSSEADDTRARISQLLTVLEDNMDHFRADDAPEASTSYSVDPNLLGDWELVYASNGTVVTRTGFAQALAAGAQQLPGVGLGDIVQRLSTDTQGVIQTSNEMSVGLGLFGEWKVAVEGVWRNKGDGRSVDVVFNRFKLQPVSFLGLRLPDFLPQVVVGGGDPMRDPRGGAEWLTTYVDEDLRIGKGRRSDNMFVFRRRPDGLTGAY